MIAMRRPWILTPARKWTAWLILTALDVILLGVIASLWLDVRWVRVINTLLLILLGIIGIGGLAWLWWDLRPWKAGARSVTEDDERLKKEYLAAKLGEVDERILADARRWRARQADRRRRGLGEWWWEGGYRWALPVSILLLLAAMVIGWAESSGSWVSCGSDCRIERRLERIGAASRGTAPAALIHATAKSN
jgi:hypothetical protein